jgi:hypothetical protein
MTMEALKHRVGKLVEGNWKEKAERLLEERKATGKGAVSLLSTATHAKPANTSYSGSSSKFDRWT